MADTKEEETPRNVVIKCGRLVRTVRYKTIKCITTFLAILIIIDLIFGLQLLISAIKIRNHLGYFINLISSGDGDTLPSLQALPVFFFMVANVTMMVNIYATFDPVRRPGLNRIMFVMVLIGCTMLIALFVVIISIIGHAYSKHESLHDGIITAMRNYSKNVVLKGQIDRLQIEFQCCGSKKYDEWYTIKWLDPSLEQGGSSCQNFPRSSRADGHAPFSCCSMKSLFPCIHHGIEVTGKAYLYTPEYNLSISTRGCYEMLREKKQQVGWIMVANLCVYLLLECFTVALYRLIQTAHFEKSRFFGHSVEYTIWLCGCYSGKVKQDPPPPPPIPPELADTND